MSDNITSKELIERLVKLSGIKKKLASEILHVIPEIIEEGLKRDGEVRVRGLGTFRLKYVMGRIGRNPKTGERVAIPAHNRLVFIPEQSFKEYINRDNRLLGYKVIPLAGESAVGSQQSAVGSQQSAVGSQQSAVGSRQSAVDGQQSAVGSQQSAVGDQDTEDRSQEAEDITRNSELFTQNSELQTQNSIRQLADKTQNSKLRRIHWIVPAAVLVIIVLSLVFYFRNFYPGSQQSAVGSRQSAVGSQQSAVGSQQSAVGSQQSAVGGQQSAVSSQQSAVGGQESAVGGQKPDEITQTSELKPENSALQTQNSKLKTQNSGAIILSEGKHLFQLSREVYGNPYLWVLIYKANQDIISDPDQAIAGKEVKIPALEGSPDKLSRNDSLEVSEGYRLVYEFYETQGDARAEDFQKNSRRYKPD